jgi:uncharacterized protein DUF4062
VKVFLSAVSDQFRACRDALAKDLRAVGATVREQEDFVQSPGTLLEKLESEIASCDRVIALVGNAYGKEPEASAFPGKPRRSYAQWEYLFGRGERIVGTPQAPKDTFVYFASPRFLSRNRIDQEPDLVALQQTFIADIRASNKDRGVFSSLHELRASVLRDGFRLPDHKPGPRNLPLYSDRIRNFLDEYLGAPASAVPFGGRDDEIEALDAWFQDSAAPPYAIVVAEAGRGKSALLVHWASTLLESDRARVVFVPISIRFNTALSSVTFAALAAGLREIFGEKEKGTDLSAEQMRSECLSYMRRIPPYCKPVLVILDGLDEASDWRPGPDLFPVSPPNGLRVLVSARYVAGDVDERGWRGRLGWNSPLRARSIPLPPLSRSGVSDVLANVSDRLSQLSTEVDVASEVFRLSEGDPLLVRLYVESLLPLAGSAVALRPADLPSISTGLAGYFERWWDDQASRTQNLGRSTLAASEDVLNFFNVCATALGPLSRDDVAEIAEGSLTSGLRIKQAAREVDRFVIGDGHTRGYVFSHPRLGQFFWEQMTAPERATWNARFLEYGRRTLNVLDKGEIPAGEASQYIVQYYGAHLDRTKAAAKDVYVLVDAGWLRAWEALEGTHAGFLNDVERAWRRAESAIPPLAGEDLAVLIKCALCRSSVTALSGNVSSKLLMLCVQNGVLTPLQGLTIVRQMPDEEQRSASLSRLAKELPSGLTGEALMAVRTIQNERHRATALIALAPHLDGEFRVEATREALAAVREITYDPDRAKTCIALAPHVTTEALTHDALALAQEIQDAPWKVRALAALAAGLEGALKASVERQAWAEVRTIKDEGSQVDLLIELAPSLQDDMRAQVVQEAFVKLRNLREWDGWASPRAEALARVAPHLSDTLRVEALDLARALVTKEAQARALTGLIPLVEEDLKEGVVREAVDAVQAIEGTEARLSALARLASYLSDAWRAQLLPDAWKAAQAIDDVEHGPMTLAALAPYLPEELLKDAMTAAQAVEGWARETILDSLRSRLPADVLEKALPSVAPRAPEELLREALAVARTKPSRESIVELISLAERLPQPISAQATKHAFSLARALEDQLARVRVAAALAPYLARPGNMLADVLAAAQTTGKAHERVETLTRVAPYLDNDVKVRVLTQALATARELPESGWRTAPRATALARLAPFLSDDLREEAVQAARTIEDKESKAAALYRVARHVSDDRKVELVREALETAQSIGDHQHRAFALERIVPDLPESERADIIQQSLDAARRSTYAVTLAGVVRRLGQYMSTELRNELLRTTLPRFDDELLSEIVRAWAPHLSATSLKRARQVARAMKDPDYQTAATAALAPYLKESEPIQEVLKRVLNIGFEFTRAVSLACLAPRLPDDLKGEALHEALRATVSVREESMRQDAMKAVAPLLPEWAHADPRAAFSVFKEMLRECSAWPRPTFLPYLEMLVPFALALATESEQETAAVGVFQAVQDVATWWP